MRALAFYYGLILIIICSAMVMLFNQTGEIMFLAVAPVTLMALILSFNSFEDNE